MKGIIRLLKEVTDDNREWIVVEGRDEHGQLKFSKSFFPKQIEAAEAFYNHSIENVTKNGFGPYITEIKTCEIE